MNLDPTIPRRAPLRFEEREQARAVMWSHKPAVRALMPKLRWLHHSPNGAKRDGFTGAQLKAMGVKPGFPDLILPVRSADQAHPGLVIEMKFARGNTTQSQDEWLEHFKAEGWRVVVLRSAEAVRDLLCEHLGVDPAAAPALDNPKGKA